MTIGRVIIPLLNLKVSTFPGPLWYFGEGIYLRGTIANEDLGALLRYLENQGAEIRSRINTKSKCIYIDQSAASGKHDPKDWADLAVREAAKVQFVLNLLSQGNPVVTSLAAILETGRKAKVARVVDLEPIANVSYWQARRFRLKPSATTTLVQETYKAVSGACTKQPQVYFTLGRFNSSLTRASDNDRLVDTTICLESLIGERDELRFKFATYLCHVAAGDPQVRHNAFQLLLALYDVRSGVVHGTAKPGKVTELLSRWNEVEEMAKAILTYYLLYLASQDQKTWNEHLKRLMLGLDRRITD